MLGVALVAVPTTGDPAGDAIALIATIATIPGAIKLIKRYFGIDQLKADVAALKKALDDHELSDNVNAAIAMGMIEVNEDAAIFQDGDGRTVYMSPKCAEIFGITLTPATMNTLNGLWLDAIHQDDQNMVLTRWTLFLKSPKPELSLQFRINRPQGSTPYRNVKVKFIKKRVGIGSVARIVGIVTVEQAPVPMPAPTQEKKP